MEDKPTTKEELRKKGLTQLDRLSNNTLKKYAEAYDLLPELYFYLLIDARDDFICLLRKKMRQYENMTKKGKNPIKTCGKCGENVTKLYGNFFPRVCARCMNKIRKIAIKERDFCLNCHQLRCDCTC